MGKMRSVFPDAGTVTITRRKPECTKTKNSSARNAEQNSFLPKVNKNFMPQKDSQTNQKDAPNAERRANKKVKRSSMMQFAQNVELKRKFLLNRWKAKTFTAEIALQNSNLS